MKDFAASGGEHQDGAGARERQRRAAAEAARGAGNDDDLPMQRIAVRLRASHAALSCGAGRRLAGHESTLRARTICVLQEAFPRNASNERRPDRGAFPEQTERR